MIILEGADGVGKTTFADALCQVMASRLGKTPQACYGHMTRPPEDFDHVAEYCKGVRAGVQDRWHLGSVVYGKILGGGSFTTPGRMLVAQRFMRWQGCVTVIMWGSRMWLRSRLVKTASAKEEMYRMEQILDANDAYWALSKSTNRGEPWCDHFIDVTTRWPTERDAETLVERWLQGWQQ